MTRDDDLHDTAMGGILFGVVATLAALFVIGATCRCVEDAHRYRTLERADEIRHELERGVP